MSLHLNANRELVAETVLLPGDPLRARFIADTFLEDVVCYNKVRNMLGYTGYYKGKRISVQGGGMGIPSTSIYVHELICDYDVQNLIRVGTCGAFQDNLSIGDIILAISASTDSGFNKIKFHHRDYAPAADFSLLVKAWNIAQEKKIPVSVGPILSSDFFYDEDLPDNYNIWKQYGILAVEMESSALYTIAARYNRKALSLLTVSDNLATGERASTLEREKSFTHMMELALEIIH